MDRFDVSSLKARAESETEAHPEDANVKIDAHIRALWEVVEGLAATLDPPGGFLV